MATPQQAGQIPQSPGGNTPGLGKEVLLGEIYYGNNPGALRGPAALHREAKAQGHANITLKDCKTYLAGQAVYTQYRPGRKKFKTNKVKATYPGETFQIDIMDMSRFTPLNNQYRYALLGYDTYSKFTASYPMKNRSDDTVLQGLKKMIEKLPFKPHTIYWDKEGSFLSRKVQNWLKSVKIGNYQTSGAVKAPSIERFIRTVRTYLQRYFVKHNTWRWLECLERFIGYYNRRKHSVTKVPPTDLATDPMIVLKPEPDNRRLSARLQKQLPPIGSYVRLNRLRHVFEKEASGTFGSEIFKVVKHKIAQKIPMIRVEDLTGELILGSLYKGQYQPVVYSGEKTIRAVLKKRGAGRRAQVQVSYYEYPEKYSEWIPAADLSKTAATATTTTTTT